MTEIHERLLAEFDKQTTQMQILINDHNVRFGTPAAQSKERKKPRYAAKEENE